MQQLLLMPGNSLDEIESRFVIIITITACYCTARTGEVALEAVERLKSGGVGMDIVIVITGRLDSTNWSIQQMQNCTASQQVVLKLLDGWTQ
jgi:hypothetical protein